jgi:hypothetical protein
VFKSIVAHNHRTRVNVAGCLKRIYIHQELLSMAKGLKLGDTVTVREEMRMPRKSEVYQQGLRRIRPGDLGRIVSMAEGRSVVVEFAGGKQVKLASQRLERATAAATNGEGIEGVGRRAVEPRGAAAGESSMPDEASLIDYNNPRLITTVANRLLLSGGLKPDSEAFVVQIKLSDLPATVQKQVRALMHAKLALDPQAVGQQPKRRGRKPKNPRS